MVDGDAAIGLLRDEDDTIGLQRDRDDVTAPVKIDVDAQQCRDVGNGFAKQRCPTLSHSVLRLLTPIGNGFAEQRCLGWES